MSFRFAQGQTRRKPSLTPMIDVVFLLLVFFMLAARFGQDGALDLRIAGTGAGDWQGPPRLVQVGADGLRLNGQGMAEAALMATLTRLVETPDDIIVIAADDGVALQRLLDVMAALDAAGFTALALVDP